ncbi:uncharacterized protein An07g02320 [Aspergillus niger]|uniref:Contig An07c0050, genomic contig n=2 Tax=Aspergillus niger TaxID=5061 RepID=A2QMJ5_ASPNC|nr:uncharacterized protein An07g02320 [Aspergillus niger]CAK39323.1 unnamed protein product [Aspergillus niger]
MSAFGTPCMLLTNYVIIHYAAQCLIQIDYFEPGATKSGIYYVFFSIRSACVSGCMVALMFVPGAVYVTVGIGILFKLDKLTGPALAHGFPNK